jgi:hypothetical protein
LRPAPALSSITTRKSLVIQGFRTIYDVGGGIRIAQQEGSFMNDKVATVNTAPASTPSKETRAASPIAQPIKAEEPKAEPAVALATKS